MKSPGPGIVLRALAVASVIAFALLAGCGGKEGGVLVGQDGAPPEGGRSAKDGGARDATLDARAKEAATPDVWRRDAAGEGGRDGAADAREDVAADAAPLDAGCAPACSGTCVAGRCIETLASGQDEPFDVAVDATSVHWADNLCSSLGTHPCACEAWTSSVMRVPLAGGSPVTLTSTPFGLELLAVHDSSVHLAGSGAEGAVRRRRTCRACRVERPDRNPGDGRGRRERVPDRHWHDGVPV
jgi:hypothetical protein